MAGGATPEGAAQYRAPVRWGSPEGAARREGAEGAARREGAGGRRGRAECRCGENATRLGRVASQSLPKGAVRGFCAP